MSIKSALSRLITTRNSGNGSASVKLTERENLVKWLVAVVWWLRTIAKNLGPRMSSRSTSNARNDEIKNGVLVLKKKNPCFLRRQ